MTQEKTIDRILRLIDDQISLIEQTAKAGAKLNRDDKDALLDYGKFFQSSEKSQMALERFNKQLKKENQDLAANLSDDELEELLQAGLEELQTKREGK